MILKATNAPGPAFDDGDHSLGPTLLVDPDTGHLHCYYAYRPGNGNQILSLRTTEDGVNWSPRVTVPAPQGWGTSILDQHESVPTDERYVLLYNDITDGGLYSAFSSDGLAFTRRPGQLLGGDVDDIVDAYRDPLTHHYVVLYKAYRLGHGQGRTASGRGVRITKRTISHQLISWTVANDFLVPDTSLDEGVTEFYGATVISPRPGLLVAFVRVLRDDLGVEGVGYTSLAWSRDGLNWTRQRESFLDKTDTPGNFDASVAWIYGAVVWQGRIWLAYSAYRDGHKTGPRRVGITSVPLDRFDGLP